VAKRSQALNRRINTRGPKFGQCNICGETGQLTQDHTRPQSCGNASGVEIRSYRDAFSQEAPQHPPRRFQAGIYYQTVCARCNNLMGSDYDPALAHFCAEARGVSATPLRLQPNIQLTIKPALVLRSVLGHLAARGLNNYRKGPLTEPLRDYFLDTELPLPSGLRIYYWLYPYPGCRRAS
jgi:hypothetical protein